MKLEDRIPLDRVPTTRSRQMLSAFWRGVRAAEAGDPVNPYPDHRGGKHGHVITFSRAYRGFWQKGHDAGVEALATSTRNREKS